MQQRTRYETTVHPQEVVQDSDGHGEQGKTDVSVRLLQVGQVLT